MIIVEGKCAKEKLHSALKALLEVEDEIKAVFSLGLVARVGEDNNQHLMKTLEDLGIDKPGRGKVNVGLG